MEYREIEVTIISAHDLKKVNAFGKMTVYGVAWIYPTMKVATPVDKRGKLNPTWNSTLKLTADERLVLDGRAVIHIDLYDHGSFGDNYVGSSTVPLSALKRVPEEVVEQQQAESSLSGLSGPHITTVPVVRRSGRARGSLTVSVRMGELVNYPQQTPPYMPGQEGSTVAYPPGYGGAHHQPYPPGYGGAGHHPYPPVYGGAGHQPYPGSQQAPYYPYGGYAPPPPPRYGMGGGSGFGPGLLGGALGGLLLGSLLGDGFGGDGGGFGGCGGF